jgi:hypothetical protein
MTSRQEDAVARRAAREARRAASNGNQRQMQEALRPAPGPEEPVVSARAVRSALTAAAVGAAAGIVGAIAAGGRRPRSEMEPNSLERFEVLRTRAPVDSSAVGTAFERVLERGIDIVGDITIRLRNVELVTIELRLPIAAASKPRQIAPKE